MNSSFPKGVCLMRVQPCSIAEKDIENHKIDELYEFLNDSGCD